MSKRNENSPGYKKTKVGWIPEEWDCQQFGSVFDIQLGKMLNEKARLGTNQKPYLANYNVRWGFFNLTNVQTMHFSPKEEAKFELRCGDLLVCEGGEVGRSSIWNGQITPCYYQKALHRLRPRIETINIIFTHYFLFWAMNSPLIIHFIGQTSIAHFTQEQFVRFPLPLPPLPEQKKIAEILSSWDRAIEQINKLINAKQRLKKSLMQQLLTGRMRFPEFGKPVKEKGELPKGWCIKPLSRIAQISFSGVDKKMQVEETPVRLCNYMDVYANEYITANLNFMTATALASEIERFSLQQGDVIITKDSETPDDIGIPAIVTEELENVVCGYHLALIRPNAVEVDPIFLSKELGSARLRKHFTTHANGATRFGLTTSAVIKTTIHLPAIDEQKRIAGTLSACDDEIQLLTQKRDLLQEQKKGLMQKLLTGAVRVKLN